MINSTTKSFLVSGNRNKQKGKIKTLIFVGFFTILTFTSCMKYPDGPLLDFRSTTERVSNNWKIGEALENDKDVTSDYSKYELSLTKEGDANLTANYKVFGVVFEFVTDGTWAFVSKEEKITFNFDNDNADGVFKILRLTEDEMWLENSDETLELHFINQ